MTADERGLWAAVLAAPDDDLPRLVYADWLEENGRGPLAAFIRAQIDLARVTPGHPDYVDLVERQTLAVARVRGASSLPVPELPDGAAFGGSIDEFTGDGYGHYHRGFPASAGLDGRRLRSGPAALVRAVNGLVERTTVRGVWLGWCPAAGVEAVVDSAGSARLTGLAVGPEVSGDPFPFDRLVRSPVASTLQSLALNLTSSATAEALAALAAGRFDRLTDFALYRTPGLMGNDWDTPAAADWAALARAPWPDRLTAMALDAGAAGLLAAMGPAAGLHTLDLFMVRDRAAGVAAALSDARTPRLARLILRSVVIDGAAGHVLARRPLPPLASVGLIQGTFTVDGVAAIVQAPWLAGVRELGFRNCPDAVGLVAALARGPAAAGVRALHVQQCDSAAADLLAAAAFTALTTLDVPIKSTRQARDAVPRFAEAWANPGLRSLTLDGWPAGNPGATRLAKNPAFAGLRRLKLRGCGIGDAGAAALVASPHLQNLVELDLANNAVGDRTAAALMRHGCLPHLALADLTGNRLKPDARAALRAARPEVWA